VGEWRKVLSELDQLKSTNLATRAAVDPQP
jgi:hypothetical protein